MPHYDGPSAFSTGVALIGLGYSVWHAQRAAAAPLIVITVSSKLEPAGAR